jgi:hypothetical protein
VAGGQVAEQPQPLAEQGDAGVFLAGAQLAGGQRRQVLLPGGMTGEVAVAGQLLAQAGVLRQRRRHAAHGSGQAILGDGRIEQGVGREIGTCRGRVAGAELLRLDPAAMQVSQIASHGDSQRLVDAPHLVFRHHWPAPRAFDRVAQPCRVVVAGIEALAGGPRQ